MHLDAQLRTHANLFAHKHLTRVLGVQERRIEATSGDEEYETQRLVIFERLEGYESLPEVFGMCFELPPSLTVQQRGDILVAWMLRMWFDYGADRFCWQFMHCTVKAFYCDGLLQVMYLYLLMGQR